MRVPIATSDQKRTVSRLPHLPTHNRFFESNPVLSDDQVSLISRPGLKNFITVGDGPIRGMYSCPGTFSDAEFVISGLEFHRIEQDGTPSLITTLSGTGEGSATFAAVGTIADIPDRLFFCEGGVLYCYSDNGNAIGQLQASGAIANGDKVTLGVMVYQFTNASVDAGTPAGTAGNPWLVALGVTVADAILNLYNAINATGLPGTDYSTALTENTVASASSYTGTDLYVIADAIGIEGNSIATTETGANLAWGGATLSGGGGDMIIQVAMPDDVGAISLAHINSYIVVIPASGQGVNGRFYWIEPGEIVIDPLNFATAERSPDPVHQVIVFSEMFWLLGETTTEPWVTTGDPAVPMAPFKGILYDRGTWEGTAVQIKDSLVLCDPDGAVFQISGGLKRISTPAIEERIRLAIQRQNSSS